MKEKVKRLDNTVGTALVALSLYIGIGGAYWLWLAISTGSALMFAIGVIPLFYPVTAPIGAWSLAFGTPSWVSAVFG